MQTSHTQCRGKKPFTGTSLYARGFTLVEIIIVISITAIISVMLTQFILKPIAGFTAQAVRGQLVDQAENVVRRMQREIRTALPNSVRVTNLSTGVGVALELYPTIDGGRYRVGGSTTCAGADPLNFSANDTDFDVEGVLQQGNPPAGSRIVVYNLGQPNADAYAGTDVITPVGAITRTQPGAACGNDHLTMPAFRFRFASLSQRFFIVTTPVSYFCSQTLRTLVRYDGYAPVAAQPNNPGAPPSAGSQLVGNVSLCQITYASGTEERAGTVTLALTVNDINSGEQVRVLHQVKVDNAP